MVEEGIGPFRGVDGGGFYRTVRSLFFSTGPISTTVPRSSNLHHCHKQVHTHALTLDMISLQNIHPHVCLPYLHKRAFMISATSHH